MTDLIPMRQAEFASFIEMVVGSYAADNVAAGRWPADEALSLSRAETERLLPQGLATPDNYLYEVLDGAGGNTVGHIWFAAMARGSTKVAFVYQVQVKPEFRRQGHARAALKATESIAKAKGFSGIALHVFGHNEGAQSLYASLGYQVASVNMFKPFSKVAPNHSLNRTAHGAPPCAAG